MKRLSLFEARAAAFEMLKQAERERMEVADAEAARGLPVDESGSRTCACSNGGSCACGSNGVLCRCMGKDEETT